MKSVIRKAAGFQPIKQFQHKAKHREGPEDSRRIQGTRLSNWSAMTATARRVDTDRVNTRGAIYTQPFDPRPRIGGGR